MTPDQLHEAMPFARTLGLTLLQAEADLVAAEMAIRPDLCTAGGVAHGGAIIGLADSLGGVGAFLGLQEGAAGTTTIESKTNLVGAAKSGETVTARATPVHRGKRLQVWKTEVTDGAGRLIALTAQTQMTL